MFAVQGTLTLLPVYDSFMTTVTASIYNLFSLSNIGPELCETRFV